MLTSINAAPASCFNAADVLMEAGKFGLTETKFNGITLNGIPFNRIPFPFPFADRTNIIPQAL